MTWAYAMRYDNPDLDDELAEARRELEEATQRGLDAAHDLEDFFLELRRQLRFPLESVRVNGADDDA